MFASAIVESKITCDLPLHTVSFDPHWKHSTGLWLVDPEFGTPGRVNFPLSVHVFIEVVMHGWRMGMPGLPSAFETLLGWVLAERTGHQIVSNHAITLHTSIVSGDDVLQKFWEIKECVMNASITSPEKRYVVKRFNESHSCTTDGRFIVPLLMKPGAKALGESTSTAVRHLLSLK